MVTDVSVSSRSALDTTLTERQWVRRGELLEAARRVFERDGYHAATVSSIVQNAGLSQGAFYLYFNDKKAIFGALQEEMATLLRRRIYWATKDEKGARLRLVAGLRTYFEYYLEYSEYNRRLMVEGLGIDPAFEARHRDLYEMLVVAFRPTMEELGVAAPALAGFALIGMATELAYWQYSHPARQRTDPQTLAQACASLFLNGAPSLDSEGGANATG
jgi:AcrR family transcriptional regulator